MAGEESTGQEDRQVTTVTGSSGGQLPDCRQGYTGGGGADDREDVMLAGLQPHGKTGSPTSLWCLPCFTWGRGGPRPCQAVTLVWRHSCVVMVTGVRPLTYSCDGMCVMLGDRGSHGGGEEEKDEEAAQPQPKPGRVSAATRPSASDGGWTLTQGDLHDPFTTAELNVSPRPWHRAGEGRGRSPVQVMSVPQIVAEGIGADDVHVSCPLHSTKPSRSTSTATAR